MPDTYLPFLKPHSKSSASRLREIAEQAVTISHNPYQYTQLNANQIRIIRISIEPTTGILVCNFDIRDLASCLGAYRAVSYCWGDPTPTHRVLCSNGQSLLITNSAAEILKFVAPRHPADFFWIDQLCINQADFTEKAEQVLLMGQIYSSAKQVVAWLGRGDKRDEAALSFVEILFREIGDMERKGLQPTLVPLMSLPARIRHVPNQMQASQKWRALSHLLRNPWFERIWVMQEVIMACVRISPSESSEGNVLLSFERCTIHFELLATVLRIIEEDHLHSNLVYDRQNKESMDELGMEPPGFGAIKIFSSYREMRRQGTPILLNLALDNAWHFKASNDRDKLYAVLGFTDEELVGRSLRPNYESKVEDVYTAWTITLLERSNDYPMLLHMAGKGLQRSYSTLPSWVPDFSSKSFEVRLGSFMTRNTRGQHYQASGISDRTEITIKPLSLSLHIQAILIDTVDVVYEQPSSAKGDRWYHNLKPSRIFTPDKHFHRSSLQWINDIKTFLSIKPSTSRFDEDQRHEVLWQTLLGDYPTTNTPLDSELSQAYEYWYQAQRELAGRDKSSLLSSISRKPEVYDLAQKFEDLKAASLHDRPVFGTTRRRLLGHGPKGLLPGDTVCIVKGTLTPFLLRACDGSNIQGWNLVGDCFVYGLMYGEGLGMGEFREFAIT